MSDYLFDKPAGPNPIDRERVVGKPYDRIDGPLKVTGRARYAYEYLEEVPNVAYGWMLGAGIGNGRIASIDTHEAEAAPGVLLVMTHLNAPRQGPPVGDFAPQLIGPEIHFFDQAIALVVAETLEQANHAAHLIRVSYDREPGRFSLKAEQVNAVKPAPDVDDKPDTAVGDFTKGFAAAAVKVDVTYTTPDQSHTMMEPHATTARWDGDHLTVWTSNQIVRQAISDLSGTLLILPENVRVVAAYVGGGFGAKLWIQSDVVLAALGARAVGRPVKLALARPQIMNNTTRRAATIQRVRIGASRDGAIQAIAHETWSGNQPNRRPEEAANQTRLLYAGKDRMTATRVALLDLTVGSSMRAPGEAVGLLALEGAMDELAEQLGMDPVELRIRNNVQYDPEVGPSRPFSSRHLVECLRTGAERFGWARRNPRPGQVRDGPWLIGMGMASAIRGNPVQPSRARVTLRPDATLLVETQMTDLGTGSYTILGQTAAEMLGLPLDKVEVLLGDSRFPSASGSGGSYGANSSTSGLYVACQALRSQLAKKAGFDPAQADFSDGQVRAGPRAVSLASLAGPEGVTAEDGIVFAELEREYAQASFGAHFCEAAVDLHTGEVRVRRMLTVATAGRILNPKTARSQCLGGITMGIGSALMEDAVVDTRLGYFVNHDMASYHVPVNADIPQLEVIFLPELDDKSSPMKAKGLGELGICGVGAAVASAIYNATGVRVRDYPLTLDKLLPGLPRLSPT